MRTYGNSSWFTPGMVKASAATSCTGAASSTEKVRSMTRSMPSSFHVRSDRRPLASAAGDALRLGRQAARLGRLERVAVTGEEHHRLRQLPHGLLQLPDVGAQLVDGM